MQCLWYKRSSVGFGIATHSRAAGDAFVKHGTGIAAKRLPMEWAALMDRSTSMRPRLFPSGSVSSRGLLQVVFEVTEPDDVSVPWIYTAIVAAVIIDCGDGGFVKKACFFS